MAGLYSEITRAKTTSMHEVRGREEIQFGREDFV